MYRQFQHAECGFLSPFPENRFETIYCQKWRNDTMYETKDTEQQWALDDEGEIKSIKAGDVYKIIINRWFTWHNGKQKLKQGFLTSNFAKKYYKGLVKENKTTDKKPETKDFGTCVQHLDLDTLINLFIEFTDKKVNTLYIAGTPSRQSVKIADFINTVAAKDFFETCVKINSLKVFKDKGFLKSDISLKELANALARGRIWNPRWDDSTLTDAWAETAKRMKKFKEWFFVKKLQVYIVKKKKRKKNNKEG